jgi:hypothetical protein
MTEYGLPIIESIYQMDKENEIHILSNFNNQKLSLKNLKRLLILKNEQTILEIQKVHNELNEIVYFIKNSMQKICIFRKN